MLILRDEEDGGLGDALAKAFGDRGVIQVVLGKATESRAAGMFGIDRGTGRVDRLLAQLKPLAAVYMLGDGRRARHCCRRPRGSRTNRSAAADAFPAGSVWLRRCSWSGLPVRVSPSGRRR